MGGTNREFGNTIRVNTIRIIVVTRREDSLTSELIVAFDLDAILMKQLRQFMLKLVLVIM